MARPPATTAAGATSASLKPMSTAKAKFPGIGSSNAQNAKRLNRGVNKARRGT